MQLVVIGKGGRIALLLIWNDSFWSVSFCNT